MHVRNEKLAEVPAPYFSYLQLLFVIENFKSGTCVYNLQTQLQNLPLQFDHHTPKIVK